MSIRSVMVTGFSHEAFSSPGYFDPVQRLKAMDRDAVDAEILYSEVSAFRHYPHMKDGWREASEAFNRFMLDFCLGRPCSAHPCVSGSAHGHRVRRRSRSRGLAAEGA